MRFIIMHKTNARWEAGERPSGELIAGVGRIIGEMAQAGVLRAGEGLRASSQGVRLKFASGKRTITKGPFTGANELLAGFAILRVRSLDAAVAWATRLGEILRDVEIDVRPVTEPWDLGIAPVPPNLTARRFMMMHKADKRTEAGVPLAPAQRAAVQALMDDMTKAGVLLSAEGFLPSANDLRLQLFGGKLSVTDGPFTESKELVAGFVILELESRKQALTWAERYLPVLGEVEADVRQLADWPESS